MRLLRIPAILAVVALRATAPWAAETASIPASRDNTLIEDPGGSVSNGSGPFIFAGRTRQSVNGIRRAVIAFDVAGAVPAGSTILSASLRMTVEQSQSGRADLSLHRLLADWGEGASSWTGGRGADAEPGDATWIHTHFDTGFWNVPGGDYDPAASAVSPAGFLGTVVWGPAPEMRQDVQAWLDDPASQLGWIVIGDERRFETAKKIASREHPDAARRPVLVVEFDPPCLPDPRGEGYWVRQCLGLGEDAGGLDPGRKGRGPGTVLEPGFDADQVACADELLASMGPSAAGACRALVTAPSGDPCDRALRKAAALALNVCSGRLQRSCPVSTPAGWCGAATVSDLLDEIRGLISSGGCRRARRCLAGFSD